METEELKRLWKLYDLKSEDFFKHKNYTIITRSGIEKIQAKESISIHYKLKKCKKKMAVVKAVATKDNISVETYGSAIYGEKEWVKFDKVDSYGRNGKWVEHGNTTTWYIVEMAEKRAFSRAVLKITGLYKYGIFGEDESESFKKK
jgi:hypothetical protein